MGENFGTLPGGQTVERLKIEGYGLSAHILTYGAILQDLRLDAIPYPLVLGYSNLDAYLAGTAYFGAIVGRCANRIDRGAAVIDGTAYQLNCNEKETHTLHGGRDGSNTRLWHLVQRDHSSLTLVDILPDGHMGFPGELTVNTHYKIIHGPALRIEITASSTRPTLCNFAHHGYFNLNGSGTVLDHQLQIHADRYLPTNTGLIPTGTAAGVSGTAFDFRTLRDIEHPDAPDGYDHNFCLSEAPMPERAVARLTDSVGDLSMTLATTEPGLQVYVGPGTKSPLPGLTGCQYPGFAAIALEPQRWPNVVDAQYPMGSFLGAQSRYHQMTTFQFGSRRC